MSNNFFTLGIAAKQANAQYIKVLLLQITLLTLASAAFYGAFLIEPPVSIYTLIILGAASGKRLSDLAVQKTALSILDLGLFALSLGYGAGLISAASFKAFLLAFISGAAAYLLLLLIELFLHKGFKFKIVIGLVAAVTLDLYAYMTFIEAGFWAFLISVIMASVATVVNCYAFKLVKHALGIEKGLKAFNSVKVNTEMPHLNAQVAELFFPYKVYSLILIALIRLSFQGKH